MSRLRLRTAAASTNPMTRRSLRRAPLQQDSCLLASSAVYPIPFVFTRVHSQLKVCVLPIRRRGYRSEIRRAMILSNSLCEPIQNQYAVSPRTRARAPYCSPIRIHQRPGASCSSARMDAPDFPARADKSSAQYCAHAPGAPDKQPRNQVSLMILSNGFTRPASMSASILLSQLSSFPDWAAVSNARSKRSASVSSIALEGSRKSESGSASMAALIS